MESKSPIKLYEPNRAKPPICGMKIQQQKSANMKATIWLLVNADAKIPIATNAEPIKIKPT